MAIRNNLLSRSNSRSMVMVKSKERSEIKEVIIKMILSTFCACGIYTTIIYIWLLNLSLKIKPENTMKNIMEISMIVNIIFFSEKVIYLFKKLTKETRGHKKCKKKKK